MDISDVSQIQTAKRKAFFVTDRFDAVVSVWVVEGKPDGRTECVKIDLKWDWKVPWHLERIKLLSCAGRMP